MVWPMMLGKKYCHSFLSDLEGRLCGNMSEICNKVCSHVNFNNENNILCTSTQANNTNIGEDTLTEFFKCFDRYISLRKGVMSLYEDNRRLNNGLEVKC